MSTTTHPGRLPARPAPDLYRHLIAAWAHLFAAALRARVLASRLIGWFAEEPARIRAAVLGVLASVAVGTVIGAAVGFATVQVVTLALAWIRDPF